MNIVIAMPSSEGLKKDQQVVASAVKHAMANRKYDLQILLYTSQLLNEPLDDNIELQVPSHIDVVIFLERIVNHRALLAAKHRVLIPNPEYFRANDLKNSKSCGWVWHKSRYSLAKIAPALPWAKHAYTGFTSMDPGKQAVDFNRFGQFRGNLYARRQSKLVIEAWTKNPDWPDLYLHFYTKDIDRFAMPAWFRNNNICIRMGWMEAEAYWNEFSHCGIHLGISEMEGFGHYINEARAIGAAQIVTDAAPMNELVDGGCGILLKPEKPEAQNFALRHKVSPDTFCAGVRQMMGLSEAERRKMGARGRARYQEESQLFLKRFSAAFQALG